jgi:hypothetical protein
MKQMVKKRFLFAILLVVFSFSAFAQQRVTDSLNNTYKQEILLNPINFIAGGFEVGYGKIRGNKNMRLLVGYYFLEEPSFLDDDDFSVDEKYTNMEGFRGEFQYLYLAPTRNNFRYYVGGFITLKNISLQVSKKVTMPTSSITTEYTAKAFAGSLGIIFGTRIYTYENIFVDVFTGGGLTIPFSSSNIDDVNFGAISPVKKSINPRGGLTLGYAF